MIEDQTENQHLRDLNLFVASDGPGRHSSDAKDGSFGQPDQQREGQHVVHLKVGECECSFGEVISSSRVNACSSIMADTFSASESAAASMLDIPPSAGPPASWLGTFFTRR
jgi:hypothetical protein